MPNSIILFFVLSISTFSFSQRHKKDQFVSKSGFTINEGDEIELGIGTLSNGNFKFIFYSGSVMEAIIDADQNTNHSAKKPLDKKYSSEKVKINKIKNGNLFFKKRSIGSYNIIGEAAVQVGEIVIPQKYRMYYQNKDKSEQRFSIADELTKLKKLYDDGVLTKEEFEAQKKKLLGN